MNTAESFSATPSHVFFLNRPHAQNNVLPLHYYYLHNTKLSKRNETQCIWVWKWWIGGLLGTYKVLFFSFFLFYVAQHDNIVNAHFLLVLSHNMSCNARDIIKRKKDCWETLLKESYMSFLDLMLLYCMPLRDWFLSSWLYCVICYMSFYSSF